MPRVTNQDQYGRYHSLYYAWHKFRHIYGIFSPTELRDLLLYYFPTQPLTEMQHRIHRRNMRKAEPGLPSKAGKLYLQLERAFAQAIKGANGDINVFNEAVRPWLHKDNLIVSKRRQHRKLERVIIEAHERPEVDWDKFAYAVLRLTKITTERDL